MPKQLTELQEKFLNALFGEAKGNYAKAMRIAGYAPSTNSHVIVQSLRSEIIERAELEMAANALSKVEKLNVSSDKPIGLFILPEKKKNDDIEEVESYKQV
mgnify:CR=1 FL=1